MILKLLFLFFLNLTIVVFGKISEPVIQEDQDTINCADICRHKWLTENMYSFCKDLFDDVLPSPSPDNSDTFSLSNYSESGIELINVESPSSNFTSNNFIIPSELTTSIRIQSDLGVQVLKELRYKVQDCIESCIFSADSYIDFSVLIDFVKRIGEMIDVLTIFSDK